MAARLLDAKQLKQLSQPGCFAGRRGGRRRVNRAVEVEAGLTFSSVKLAGLTTVDQWVEARRQRNAARIQHTMLLRDPAVPGPEKQHIRCDYVKQYRHTLFSCPNCWLLPGYCICKLLQPIQVTTQVVVHMHHNEWGRSSNTGCIAASCLTGGSMLLRGHREDDAKMQELFDDPTVTTAVLWPGDKSILPSELKAIAAERTGGRVAVVAVDATWEGAMRMKNDYPPSALHVKLPPDCALLSGQERSLLSPVRRYRGDLETNGRVSTLEAVAALLEELEGDRGLGVRQTLLDNLRIKVDAVRVQKNREVVYGSVGGTNALAAKRAAVEWGQQVARAMREKDTQALVALGVGPEGFRPEVLEEALRAEAEEGSDGDD